MSIRKGKQILANSGIPDDIIKEIKDNANEIQKTLKPATKEEVGLVKVDGNTISVKEDGTISANIPDVDFSNVVMLDNMQTITGSKIFTDSVVFNNTQDNKTITLGKDSSNNYGIIFKSESAPHDFTILNQGQSVSSLNISGFGGGVHLDKCSLFDKEGKEIKAFELHTATTDIVGGVKVDGTTITITDETISAHGVIDDNDSNALKFWTGTLEEYEALGQWDDNTIYNVTDDAPTTQQGIPVATQNSFGVVKVDGETIQANDGVLCLNKDAVNTGVAVVIAQAQTDKYSYKHYSDGWIEYTGVVDKITEGDATYTITFPMPLSTTRFYKYKRNIGTSYHPPYKYQNVFVDGKWIAVAAQYTYNVVTEETTEYNGLESICSVSFNAPKRMTNTIDNTTYTDSTLPYWENINWKVCGYVLGDG